jgi:hypothetical protein
MLGRVVRCLQDSVDGCNGSRPTDSDISGDEEGRIGRPKGIPAARDSRRLFRMLEILIEPRHGAFDDVA